MSWTSLIAVYMLIWTVTLFAMLPIGVRTSDETGEEKIKGQADSAPVKPMIAKKMLWTTCLAAVFMAIFMLALEFGLISFN